MAKELKWYQKSLRRLLVDMHIPDWNGDFLKEISPENYAELLALAKVDTAEIYACSCLGLCYWPTKIGIQHRQLRGRDLLGELIAACRKRGMKIQIYLNVWTRAVYEAHPEWRIVLENGQTTGENSRFGHCCINTGYRQFFLDLFSELASSYDCEGYWIDMIGTYWPCYCPECRKEYLRRTGRIELPRKVDWTDPAWRDYAKFQSDSLNDFAADIKAAARKYGPERTVTFQSFTLTRENGNGIREKFLNAGEYLAGDFTGDRIDQSFISKFFSSLSSHHPMEFMTPRCESLDYHTTERDFENLLMRAYASLLNQTSFTLIDAIDPVGTLDRRFYEHARQLNETYGAYESCIDGESRPVCDMGIYYSPDSAVNLDGSDHSDRSPWHKTSMNLIRTLMRQHQLFHFVHGSDADRLKKFPIIWLSDCMFLNEEECTALEQYVEDGGRLIATFRTSLYNPDGSMRKDFRLAKLFGIHFRKLTDLNVTYIAPVKKNTLDGITAAYPLQINGRQAEISADPDAEVIGTLTRALSTFDEKRHFYAALSNPPMVRTDSPAIVRHCFGRGETLYIAGNLEMHVMDCHRKVLLGLLRSFQQGKIVETNAPPCVECTLFDQTERHRMIFSCLNQPMELPVIPLHDLYFKLRLPDGVKVRSVHQVPDNEPYPAAEQGGILELKIKELGSFAMFRIEYN